MEKEAFWDCLSKAARQFEQKAAEDGAAEEETQDAEADTAYDESGLAALVAEKMGLL